MAELKLIPTTTIVSTTPTGSPNIEIFTFYDPSYFHIISAFIADQPGSRLGAPYVEGHLIVTMRNSPSEVDVYIDNHGHLIVRSPVGEDYSLDGNGHLIGQVNIP